MGLDYSYMLYFKQEKLWDALQAVVDLAEPHDPPTRVLFPDHELAIPLETWRGNNAQLNHHDPTLDFHFGMYVEEDEEIRYWRRNMGDAEDLRSPPDGGVKKLLVGFIYLTIHTPTSERFSPGGSQGLVLFDFGTTGTRMSLMFDESPSMRKVMCALLQRVPGVCGVFNREDSGEVFWLDGQEVYAHLEDVTLLPDEIRSLLNQPGGSHGSLTL